MSEPRFFAERLSEPGGEVQLDEDAAAHVRVLRLRAGDAVELFDGRGGAATGPLCGSRDRWAVRVEARRSVPRPTPPVVLVQCLPKGKKLADIVRRATELGVDAIHPAAADRSVPRPSAARARADHARWLRVAREAARQSRGYHVPDITPLAPLEDVIGRAPGDARRIVVWEGASSGFPPCVGHTWLLVGPEGGFDPRQVRPLLDAGWVAAGLGATILRTETAAVVACALALDRLGRLSKQPDTASM